VGPACVVAAPDYSIHFITFINLKRGKLEFMVARSRVFHRQAHGRPHNRLNIMVKHQAFSRKKSRWDCMVGLAHVIIVELADNHPKLA
jgi:hypothetical protein